MRKPTFILLLFIVVAMFGSSHETVEEECIVDAETGEEVCKTISEKEETADEDEWNVTGMLANLFGSLNGKQHADNNKGESSFGTLQGKDHPTKKEGVLHQLTELLFNYHKEEQSSDDFLQSFLSALTLDLNKTHAGIELFQLCLDQTKRVKEQFSKYFDQIGLESFNAVQLYYYMLDEESRKDAVWKRRQHRFLPNVPVEEIVQLGDGMYLAQLSYCDACEDVEEYAKTFRNDTWKVVDCLTKSKPFQPASYLIVPRSEPKERDFTEAVLVVRATKEYSDILSDALLEAADYRGGKTHNGMMLSGRWLHDKYKEQVFGLLKDSGKSRLKLTIVGHSLGGGAAQLTAMEFMGYDEIDVTAAGFGAPAVFSPTMSHAVKDNITSVITDADVVARMSGASVVNAWLRVLSYNFTEAALEDVNQLFPMLEELVSPYGEWAANTLASLRDMLAAKIVKDSNYQLEVRAGVKKPMMEPVLFPAGDCIHLYRDGSAWQGVYIPCMHTSFTEIEVVKKMIDDHMTSSGYYFALLGYVREAMDNPRWNFPHDVRDLPVQL